MFPSRGLMNPFRILLTPYANEFRLKTYLGSSNAEEELRKLLEEKWKQIADLHCDEPGDKYLAYPSPFNEKRRSGAGRTGR